MALTIMTATVGMKIKMKMMMTTMLNFPMQPGHAAHAGNEQGSLSVVEKVGDWLSKHYEFIFGLS